MSSLFLQLIQPLPFSSPREITRDDLCEIREQGIRHNVFPLIYSRMRENRRLIIPHASADGFLEETKGAYLKGVTLAVRQEAIESELTSILSAHDVPSVVIRGNSLAKDIYKDPYCRTSSDIDILIKNSDVLRADSILQENKYVRNDSLPLKFWLHRIHHAIYYHPRTGDLIEIHWNFGIPYFFTLSSEEIWKEVVITDSGQKGLSPHMLIIMLLIHHHMHAFRELKILTDILWAFSVHERTLDLKQFVQRLKEIGLVKTTCIALSQMKSIWHGTISEIKIIDILYRELQNTHERLSALASFFDMNINKDYRFQNAKDTLMARFALDSLSAVARSFSKMLFPSPEVIKALYDNDRDSRLPFNYLKFIRWRVKEWMGK